MNLMFNVCSHWLASGSINYPIDIKVSDYFDIYSSKASFLIDLKGCWSSIGQLYQHEFLKVGLYLLFYVKLATLKHSELKLKQKVFCLVIYSYHQESQFHKICYMHRDEVMKLLNIKILDFLVKLLTFIKFNKFYMELYQRAYL